MENCIFYYVMNHVMKFNVKMAIKDRMEVPCICSGIVTGNISQYIITLHLVADQNVSSFYVIINNDTAK